MKGDINFSNRVLTFDTNQPFQIMCRIQFEPRGQLDDEKVYSRVCSRIYYNKTVVVLNVHNTKVCIFQRMFQLQLKFRF